jgi:hypothetical protein
MKPTVVPSPLSLDAKSGSGHSGFSDWSFPPDSHDGSESPVLSSELGKKAAMAVFCSGQPNLRAEPGSKHPRNCFMPVARVPSKDIGAVDWSGEGLPFPGSDARGTTTRSAAVPVTKSLCKPPSSKAKWSRQVSIQNLAGPNHRLRATRHLQQPKARGSKRTP